MTVIIESIESYDSRSGPGDTTKFFGASQSSIQTVTTHVRREVYLTPSTLNSNEPNQFFIQSFAANTFTNKKADPRTIHTDRQGGWPLEFKVGAQFSISGTVLSDKTGIIIEVYPDRQTIVTDQTFVLDTFTVGSIIGITTPLRSMEYKFNIIENSLPKDYTSLIDGETQRALVGQLDHNDITTPHVMVMQGKKSWQFGTITVVGNESGIGDSTLPDGVAQAFIITHQVLVSPLMLFDEWDDILARIAPARLRGGNSVKYINSIGLSEQVNNPNDIVVVEEDSLDGNVSWYDENLNGGINNYKVQNVVYKRLDDTITPSLELTTLETKLQFSVVNTVDSPFVNGSSIVILGIHFAPSDPAQYRDNNIATSKTQDFNFIFDEVVEVVGSGGTATPLQDGTELQTIKSCTATILNSSQIDFDVRFEKAPEVVERIGVNQDQRYVVFVEVANDSLSRADTDKVPLLIDANEYFTDVSDPGLIVMENAFLTHPFDDLDTEGVPFVVVFPEDELLSFNNMFLDKNGRETDDINLASIKGEVFVKKTTGAAFVVNSRLFNLNPELINDATFGGIPDVNLDVEVGFRTPADNNRGNIKFFRRYTLDGAGLFHYRWQFPHIWRWENYISLAGVNDEFFVPTDPEQGRNQDWFHYSAEPDWDLYYKATLTVNKNGNFIPFSFEQKVDMLSYTGSPNWIAEEAKSFDENDVELVDGAEGFVNGAINGTIKAKFTWAGIGATPVIGDIVGKLNIHVFEQGTFKSTYTISSAYDKHPDTYWTSTDTSNRAVVTDLGGGVFEIKAKLIGALLDNVESFSITSRIYDKRGELPPVPPAVGKLTEQGVLKKPEGATTFKIKE